MKYFEKDLQENFKNLFTNCKHGNSLTTVMNKIPDLFDQLAIINSYDWTVTQRDGVSFNEFTFPGELAQLVAPRRVVLLSSNTAKDFLNRDEFVARVAELGDVKLWTAQDFIDFTNAFYGALRLRADNSSSIGKCREEVVLADGSFANYGVKLDDGSYAAVDNDYKVFPFVLDLAVYRDAKYNEDINSVRAGYIGITLNSSLNIDSKKTK